MHIAIQTEALTHCRLREQLFEMFPDIDDDTLRDTLDGETNLNEMLAALVRSYLDDQALSAALRQRIADMEARRARYDARGQRKRDFIAEVMETTGLQKLVEPDFTVSFRATPPALVVLDEGVIPTPYWMPQPAKLDRATLKQTLERGEAVPGAALSNGGRTIAVRTK